MYFVTLRLHDVKTLQCPLNTQWKYILLIYFTLLVKALFPSFHYSLGIYIYFFAIHFTKSKFIKFVMSLLKPRVSCSSNFASLFRVIRDNSSVLFHLNLYMLWTNGAHQSANFQTSDHSHENNQIPYIIFQAMCKVSFKFWFLLNLILLIPPNFLVETSCFQQKEPIKVQYFGLFNALMKVHPISHFTHLCWELSYARTHSSLPCIKM